MTLSVFIDAVVFIMFFALSNAVSNALVSVSMVFSALLMIKTVWKRLFIFKTIPKLVISSIGLFLGSVMLASFLSGEWQSCRIAWLYIYWSLPFLIMYCLCYRRKMDKIVLAAIGLSVLFTSSYSIYQNYVTSTTQRIGGFYYNPNFYAVLLILTLPFLILNWSNKKDDNNRPFFDVLCIVPSLTGVYVLGLTGSRGAMLGFLVSAIFVLLLFFKYHKTKNNISVKVIISLILVALIAIGMGGIRGNSTRAYDMERIYLLKSSYHIWQDNKLLGVGLARWAETYQKEYICPEAREKNLVIPHNTIAWFFSSTGIVGGIGYLLFSLGIFVYLLRVIKNEPDDFFGYAMIWAYLAFFIHGMVDVGITMKSSCRLFFVLLGWSVARSVIKGER